MSHLRERGKTYWIYYYENGKRVQKSLKTKDKAYANYLQRQIDNELAIGNTPLAHNKVAVEAIKDKFLETIKGEISEKQRINYRGILESFIETIQPKTLLQINDENYCIFREAYGKSIYWECAVIAALKRFLGWCLSRNYLTYVPLRVRKPSPPQTFPRYFSRTELKEIWAAAIKEEEPLPTMIKIAIHTGMRRGEIGRLNLAQDINWSKNTIIVRKSKTGKFRFVPLSKELRSFLKNRKVKIQRPPNERKDIARIKRTSGVQDVPRFWYTLRHSFASHYYMATHDIKGLSEILGHSSIEVTARIYTHLDREFVKRNIDRVKL